MNRLPEESEAGPSRNNEEGIFPLTLTITQEFIRSIESTICPHQQNLIPQNLEKQKPMHFSISEITIGEWTHKSRYQVDLKAKIYFKRRRLIWEILDDEQTETQVARLKRKIEIKWSDILSFRATFNPRTESETLEVELENRPTFFMETNLQAEKQTQWKEIEDFTLNQSASKFRRHTLHFHRGDLQQNLEQLVSGDNFWSTLAKNRFPIYDDVGYGDSNNNDSINLSSYNVNNDIPTIQEEGETSNLGELRGTQAFAQDIQPNSMIYLHMNDPPIYPNGLEDYWLPNMDDMYLDDSIPINFGVGDGDRNNNDSINLSSYNVNNDIPNYYPPGNHQIVSRSQLLGKQVTHPSSELIYGGMNSRMSHFNNWMIQEEGETSKTGELRGRTNSLDQDNQQIETMSQLPAPQVTDPSSQLNNEGMNITVPPIDNPTIQEEGETSNAGELRGSQAFAQDIQPNPMIGSPIGDWLDLDGWINLDENLLGECFSRVYSPPPAL